LRPSSPTACVFPQITLRKGTGFLCHDALAHGTFLHFGQSGNAGRTPNSFFDFITIFVDVAVIAVHARRLLSLLPGELSRHAALFLLYETVTIMQIAFYMTVSRESLPALR